MKKAFSHLERVFGSNSLSGFPNLIGSSFKFFFFTLLFANVEAEGFSLIDNEPESGHVVTKSVGLTDSFLPSFQKHGESS